jgi:hypothetical protein
MPSSGVWRCVALVRTDVSGERIASIRVERIGELGTTSPVWKTSGQFDAPGALPPGELSPVPSGHETGWAAGRGRCREEKNIVPLSGKEPRFEDHSVQFSCWIDWAITAVTYPHNSRLCGRWRYVKGSFLRRHEGLAGECEPIRKVVFCMSFGWNRCFELRIITSSIHPHNLNC